jgi:hypothetical protein
MKKDKPERIIAANPAKGVVETVLPAKMERTEFMKRLMTIPTPALPATSTHRVLSVPVVVTPPAPATNVPVIFEVAHPESSMVGTPIKLMVSETEQLHGVKKTLADMGVAPIGNMVLWYAREYGYKITDALANQLQNIKCFICEITSMISFVKTYI